MNNKGKINSNNQFGLRFTQEMRRFIVKNQASIIAQYPDPKGQVEATMLIDDIVSDEKNRNYCFTQSANAVCNKIKIEKFEPEFLNLTGKKYKKATLLIDDRLFYRVIITDKEIFCLICDIRPMPMPTLFHNVKASPEPQEMFFYTTFRIIPSNNQINLPVNESLESDRIQKFLRYLIFFEFSEITQKLLLPNQSTGTKREGKFRNESNSKLTIVDSMWNTYVMVEGEFTVSGHFRLQPCGEGRKNRKLVYIEEYRKDGYTRKAGKDTI